ncbi:MAG: hypothetical protein R2828_00715 [Saprospiraceae bacterium]
MIESHQLKVVRTAHFYSIGTSGPEVKYLLIACHGYGQLAQHFIRKFDVLHRADTLIVAPEGLSRFYWDGLTGKVASSWMTKANRLDEIADYSQYLSTLYQQYKDQLAKDVHIILLGFSQGAATQVRWAMQDFPAFHTLILWGGMIPEDLDYLPHAAYWANKKIYAVFGTADEYLTPDRLQFHSDLIRQQQLQVEERSFTGGHTIDRDALVSLFSEIRGG